MKYILWSIWAIVLSLMSGVAAIAMVISCIRDDIPRATFFLLLCFVSSVWAEERIRLNKDL